MKRRDLLRHLKRHGAEFVREGARHSIYTNPVSGVVVAVPRHREVKEDTARSLCAQLGIPNPR